MGEWEAVRVWKDERCEAVRVPWKDVRGKGVVSKPPMCRI